MFKIIAEKECAWVGLPWFGILKNDMVTPAKRMITGTSMEVDGHKPMIPFVYGSSWIEQYILFQRRSQEKGSDICYIDLSPLPRYVQHACATNKSVGSRPRHVPTPEIASDGLTQFSLSMGNSFDQSVLICILRRASAPK